MKSKLFLIGIILILVLPLILAEGEEIQFEPNKNAEIITKCFDINSGLCSPNTKCDIDVFYPNNTLYIDNRSMNNSGTYFNYTISNVSVLGVYEASVSCRDATTKGYNSFHFYVGRPTTPSQNKMTITIIIVLLVIAVALFFGGYNFEKFSLKWSFFLLALFFFVVVINISSVALWNEAGSENVRKIMDQIGAASYYLYYFIGGLFLVIWILTMIASLSDKKRMRQARATGEVQMNMHK